MEFPGTQDVPKAITPFPAAQSRLGKLPVRRMPLHTDPPAAPDEKDAFPAHLCGLAENRRKDFQQLL